MEDKEDLYIPVKIRKRKEWIEGIGKEEAIQILILCVVGSLVGYIAHLIKGYDLTFIMFPAIGFASLGYFFLKRNSYNKNTVDQIKQNVKFRTSQRVFRYKYYNIYEGRYRERSSNEER